MDKPILYILAPGFNDRGRPEFCPESAELWGVLSYFPAIKEALDIRYMPIARPRAEMVEQIGKENQNCPTLVFAPGTNLPEGVRSQINNGHIFLDNARDIAVYFAKTYATPYPRGYL